MSYSHMLTEELLDLADDYLSLANTLPISRALSARQKLAEIEDEIDYRQPVEEFRDLEDGFEPYVPDFEEAE